MMMGYKEDASLHWRRWTSKPRVGVRPARKVCCAARGRALGPSAEPAAPPLSEAPPACG
jgi:hypothetical protein